MPETAFPPPSGAQLRNSSSSETPFNPRISELHTQNLGQKYRREKKNTKIYFHTQIPGRKDCYDNRGHSKMTSLQNDHFHTSLPCHRENSRICNLKQWKSPFLLTSLPSLVTSFLNGPLCIPKRSILSNPTPRISFALIT